MRLLIIIFILWPVIVYGQEVNGFPLKDVDQQYVRIVGSYTMTGKIAVDIDFGQKQKFFSKKDTRITDAEGKKIKFNSMVDAINFMYDFGYELDQAYAITVDKAFGKETVYHYLLKKVKQPAIDKKDN
jgi:hypothetical protein